jgi:hypothetical protein
MLIQTKKFTFFAMSFVFAEEQFERERMLIGRRGTYPKASCACQACSGNFTITEKVVNQFSDRGMDHAGIINFLSNEDTGKQACFELAHGFFIRGEGLIPRGSAAVMKVLNPSPIHYENNIPRGSAPRLLIMGWDFVEEDTSIQTNIAIDTIIKYADAAKYQMNFYEKINSSCKIELYRVYKDSYYDGELFENPCVFVYILIFTKVLAYDKVVK